MRLPRKCASGWTVCERAEQDQEDQMRTHYCGDLRANNAGETVTLAGWIHRRRDHGGVIFLDLRDREGLVQIVIHPDEQPGAHAAALRVRPEFVVRVTGAVRLRPPGTVNANLATG